LSKAFFRKRRIISVDDINAKRNPMLLLWDPLIFPLQRMLDTFRYIDLASREYESQPPGLKRTQWGKGLVLEEYTQRNKKTLLKILTQVDNNGQMGCVN
jgi:hypothetical protein